MATAIQISKPINVKVSLWQCSECDETVLNEGDRIPEYCSNCGVEFATAERLDDKREGR